MNDYSVGLDVLKKLHSYLRTKVTFDQFLDGLSRIWDGEKMSDEEMKEYISGLAKTKKLFLGIPYKSSSDWDAILKKIAALTPIGKLPDRKMIDSMFLNPNTTKPSFFDYASIVAKAGGQAIKKGAEIGGQAIKTYALIQMLAVGFGTYLVFKGIAQRKASQK